MTPNYDYLFTWGLLSRQVDEIIEKLLNAGLSREEITDELILYMSEQPEEAFG